MGHGRPPGVRRDNPAQVKAADVQKCADRRLRAGAIAASVHQEVCFLSGVFREALKTDLVDRNPVKQVKKPRIENTVVRFLSPEEEANLLAHAAAWLRPAMVISIHSGLRAGELRRLSWAGHLTLATAMRYAHLQEQNLREAVGVLDGARGASTRSAARSVTAVH